MWRSVMLWRLVGLVGATLNGLVVFGLGGYDDASNRPLAALGLALLTSGLLGLFVLERRR